MYFAVSNRADTGINLYGFTMQKGYQSLP